MSKELLCGCSTHLKPNNCLHGKEMLPVPRGGLVNVMLKDLLAGISWITQSSFYTSGDLATEQEPEWSVQATVPARGSGFRDEQQTRSPLSCASWGGRQHVVWTWLKTPAAVSVQPKSEALFIKFRQPPHGSGLRGRGRSLH